MLQVRIAVEFRCESGGHYLFGHACEGTWRAGFL